MTTMRYFLIEEIDGERIPVRIKVKAETYKAAIAKLRSWKRPRTTTLRTHTVEPEDKPPVSRGSVSLEQVFEAMMHKTQGNR